MFALIALLTVAQAAPLELHELPGTAINAPAGEFLIHPVAPSSWGITDNIMLQTSLLGWFGAPNATVQLGLFHGDDSAGAVAVGAASTWDLSSVSASASGLYTRGDGQRSLSLTAGVGVSRTVSGDDEVVAISTPVSGTWLKSLSDRSALRAYAQLDPLTMVQSQYFAGVVGGDWSYGWDYLRIGLGLALMNGQLIVTQLDTAGVDSTWVPVVIPFPTLALWWRLGGPKG